VKVVGDGRWMEVVVGGGCRQVVVGGLSGTRKSYVRPGFRLIISETFGNRPRRV
jgi:hypothetical protein